MSSPEEADAVVALFNNRFFGGKQISAFLWDGHTKYKIEETDAERDERLKNWEKFIAEDESSGSGTKDGAPVPVPVPVPAAPVDVDDDDETPPASPKDAGDNEEDSDEED